MCHSSYKRDSLSAEFPTLYREGAEKRKSGGTDEWRSRGAEERRRGGSKVGCPNFAFEKVSLQSET